VSEDLLGVGPASLAINESLLDAKISVPTPRPGLVSRMELIERARASDCRVIGVTAPAGYGKSSLLAEWALAEDRPVAWVSLDRLDDDPAALLSVLASAFARISPGHEDLTAVMGGGRTSTLGRGAPRFASVLRTSPEPFVLMLDDLHELQSPDCHDVLDVVMAGVPQGSQLVAASRFEQPHLPRLRASGDAMELLATDLALDATGATHIFSQANLRLTGEEAAAVAERTEGWPVGLYLSSLIAHESAGRATISGEDRYVADYLYREAWRHLADDDQRFLRRAAVLDQMTAPLCDALCEDTGSQERLRRLEAASAFLVPLDRRREWYRCHGLFREFLLGELRRVEPDVITKLHLRAADWYESNGSPVRALEHLLHTSERERTVHLMAELVQPTFHIGQVSTTLRWLSSIGDAAVEEHPPLALIATWMNMLSGRVAETLRLAAVVDEVSYDHVPPDGWASFESARAVLRVMMCSGGPEQMLADARYAVAEERAWSRWRGPALLMLGEALLLSGDVAQATPLLRESSTISAELNNTETVVVCEAELALLAIDRSQWSEAGEHVDAALAVIEEHQLHDYPACVIAFTAAARLAVHRADLKQADIHAMRAMRARPLLTFVLPIYSVRTRLQLGRVYCAIGDQATARHLLREIDDILLERPKLGTLVEEVAALRQLVTSSDTTGTHGVSPLTAAELRLLPYLQTHLTIREIAERLFVSRNTVNSQISAIYRKLGVSSRSEAVRQATAVGLLGE